jgi:hypothetical protein
MDTSPYYTYLKRVEEVSNMLKSWIVYSNQIIKEEYSFCGMLIAVESTACVILIFKKITKKS